MTRRVVISIRVQEPTAALFSMGVAASLCGLHPQTLRQYERFGFLTPHRTQGGTRLYSEADLGVAKRVAALSQMGLSREGVAMVLALEEENRALRAELDTLKA